MQAQWCNSGRLISTLSASVLTYMTLDGPGGSWRYIPFRWVEIVLGILQKESELLMLSNQGQFMFLVDIYSKNSARFSYICLTSFLSSLFVYILSLWFRSWLTYCNSACAWCNEVVWLPPPSLPFHLFDLKDRTRFFIFTRPGLMNRMFSGTALGETLSAGFLFLSLF